MKNKLIPSILVVVMLLAGGASAGDMHYKVYGVAHVSTDFIDNADDSSIFVSSNTSRIGIKGHYATDCKQLTVVFKYESWANFNNDLGNNNLATRDSWAGLKGDDWGMVGWGRRNTPFKMVGYYAINIFAERLGDYRNATAYWGTSDGPIWDARVPDAIFYTSPALGDMVTIDVLYAPEEGVEDNSLLSGSVTYKQDGLMLGVAYEMHGTAREPGGPEDATGLRVAGKYHADRFMVGGLFQTITNADGIDGADVTVFGGAAQYTVTPQYIVKGHYFLMDPEGDDTGGSLLALGVDRVLNDMATLYVAYFMTTSDDNAYYTLGRGGHGQKYAWTGDAGDQYGEGQMGVSVGLYAKW